MAILSRIKNLFIIYVASLFIFAGFYYGIYVRAPHTFSFNSDILAAQIDIIRTSAKHDLEKYLLKVNLLQQLVVKMDQGINPPRITENQITEFVTDDYHYIFSQYALIDLPDIDPLGGLVPVVQNRLQIRDKDGNEISNDELPDESFVRLPKTVDDGKELATHLITTYQQKSGEIQGRLNTLSNPSPEVWSFWDFLYFSTITQTTVGYGDILPNSTVVRMLVIVQVILGIALLGFAANSVLSKGSSST